jgi:hypothetical protein
MPNDNLSCTMGRDTERARSNRHNPENMAVAYAFQLHDSVVNLRSMAMAGDYVGLTNSIQQIRGFLDIMERQGEARLFLPTRILETSEAKRYHRYIQRYMKGQTVR